MPRLLLTFSFDRSVFEFNCDRYALISSCELSAASSSGCSRRNVVTDDLRAVTTKACAGAASKESNKNGNFISNVCLALSMTQLQQQQQQQQQQGVLFGPSIGICFRCFFYSPFGFSLFVRAAHRMDTATALFTEQSYDEFCFVGVAVPLR